MCFEQDDVSAFQLMEFEMKFNKVKKMHRKCISALKSFWQVFYRHKKTERRKKKYSEYLADKVNFILLLFYDVIYIYRLVFIQILRSEMWLLACTILRMPQQMPTTVIEDFSRNFPDQCRFFMRMEAFTM